MAYIYDLADTWSAIGTVFTGIKLNVTDTASAAGSLLMDLQVGGASKVSVAKNGDVSLHNAQKLVIGTDFNLDHYLQLYASSRIYPGGNSIIAVGGISNRYAALGLGGLTLSSTDGLGWNSSGPWSLTGATPDRDLTLVRDAANTLAQRNGTAAQTKRLYGTYTNDTNYERGYFTTDTNGLTIGHEALGTGIKRPVRIVGPALASAEAVSILDMSQTWNTTGSPTGVKLNVTDTASNAASLLMDLQTGGTSRFSVRKDGRILAGSVGLELIFSAAEKALTVGGGGVNFGGIRHITGSSVTLLAGTSYSTTHAADAVLNGALGLVGWHSSTYSFQNLTPDLALYRDAANTLAQRNGANNPQAFNIYNTYTDANNYERGFMRWSSNILRIGTEKGTTGTARALEFQVDGTTCLSVSSDGTKIALGVGLVSSGGTSTALGRLAIASGSGSFAAGQGISANTGPEATGAYSIAVANSYSSRKSTASGIVASVFGGSNALADKFGQNAYGFNGFTDQGDAQTSTLGFVGATTNDTATEIFLFNVTNQRAIIPANKTWAFVLTAVARSSGGTDNAMYIRRGIIKRDAANNTTLVGSVDSVYTNETNAAWDIAVSADDTNESLKVTVTGAAATNIRWVANVELTEVLFA